MSFPRYPEIALLARRPEIFAVKEVVCTEKLHGSNFRIHFPCGMTSIADIRYGSHDVEYVPGQPFPLNRQREIIQSDPDMLGRMMETIKSYGFSDATVFGEFYGPGMKCKGVKYLEGTTPKFRAFGLMVAENFVTYDLLCELLDKMGVPRVHEVWRGPPSKEAFDALLEKPSTEAQLNGIDDPNNFAEGIVIQSQPLLRNVFGEWLIAKHKAKKFAEVAEAPKEKLPREATPADIFAATYVTRGRTYNAIARLYNQGTPLDGNMKDMPRLLDAMIIDLHKECEPKWPAGTDDKQMRGSVSRVLGPLYRDILENEPPEEPGSPPTNANCP